MSNYLDYNASTPIDPRVLNVMIDALRTNMAMQIAVHTHLVNQQDE